MLRGVAFAVLGMVSAFGATAVMSQKAKAGDGTCYTSSGSICGLNGHNYSNKAYQGPPPN